MTDTPNLNPHAGADSTGRVLTEAEFRQRMTAGGLGERRSDRP